MKRSPPSIRQALLLPLALGLAVAIIAAAALTYRSARDEAAALFDVQLQQMAASVTGMPLAAPATALRGDADNPLVVQIWNRDGVQVYRSDPTRDAPKVAEPRNAAPGFATVPGRDGPWRVFSVLANGQVVQVGQPLRLRDDLAASMAWRTTLPLILVAPLLGLFAWFAIARALRPLDRLARAVGKRTETELDAVDASDWPSEVVPLVAALNALLARLGAALDLQRTFVADAAHELRTPLTALHLQAQLAERASNDAERDDALTAMKAGINRATRLATQLLTLAREEHASAATAHSSVDLATLSRDVVRELVPLAAARDIDLGLSDVEALDVTGDAAALATLLTNLVDNAVRYTPVGGRVDVAVTRVDGAPAMTVRDNGPGIPQAEREAVFQRFTRGATGSTLAPGSGLGMAIVRHIAERHGATVILAEGIGGAGLGVVVRFGGGALSPP